jgi:hypothetical protein
LCFSDDATDTVENCEICSRPVNRHRAWCEHFTPKESSQPKKEKKPKKEKPDKDTDKEKPAESAVEGAPTFTDRYLVGCILQN